MFPVLEYVRHKTNEKGTPCTPYKGLELAGGGGGGGPGCQDPPPPPPPPHTHTTFGGPQNFKKRGGGRNPFPKSCIRPWLANQKTLEVGGIRPEVGRKPLPILLIF